MRRDFTRRLTRVPWLCVCTTTIEREGDDPVKCVRGNPVICHGCYAVAKPVSVIEDLNAGMAAQGLLSGPLCSTQIHVRGGARDGCLMGLWLRLRHSFVQDGTVTHTPPRWT